MKYTKIVIIGLLATAVFVSCKNESEEKVEVAVENSAPEVVTKKIEEKRELTPEQNDRVNSLWSKVSMNADTKNFIRLMTSAGIAEDLLSPSSKLTVFAPTNESFLVFTEKSNITNNPEEKEALKTLLQNHIIVGSMNSSELVRAIKKNTKVELTTLAGSKLTATMVGSDIVLTNKAGATATVTKSDIMASNGVLHIVDAVLK